MPFQDHLRRMKRDLCGYRPNPVYDRRTIQQGIEQLQSIQAVVDLPSACVLEVGSGWEPLIPLLYSLAGTRETIMTDLRALLHASSVRATVDSLRANADLIRDGLQIGGDALENFLHLAGGDDLDAILKRLRLRYLAPCDVRSTALPSGSVDAVVSRAVLEHIPPGVIAGIFTESARIVRPGGVTCHLVDNSDHWEHRDKGISRINFLKFSDATFRLTCINGLNYQNRLRHPEYRRMLENAGFAIERDERTIDPEAREILEHFPIAPRFAQFSKDDLATVTSFFLARRTAG